MVRGVEEEQCRRAGMGIGRKYSWWDGCGFGLEGARKNGGLVFEMQFAVERKAREGEVRSSNTFFS